MAKISVTIIALNEEVNLPRCLKSVAWVDEIILIDSGSTDRTIEIAKEHGAIVFEVPFEGYGKSKQAALEQATGDWVLSIDADEVVPEALASEIRVQIESDTDFAGYTMPRLTQFLGRWIRHCGWYPDRILRLFRRESGRFSENPVHEGVIVTGAIGELSHDLLHYSYPTLEVYLSKFNRYTSMAAQEAFEKGRTAGVWELMVRPWAGLVKHYFLRGGFRDGVEGFLVSILSSGYILVKYAKLRHLCKQSRERERQG